ncbi:hypothetical protein [Anaerosolibacter sp.]|uniref:hypothetical protein n=1 Tax=Anaerosolibacter sp. TaxID=1872527 RepID=UPI0039EE5395
MENKEKETHVNGEVVKEHMEWQEHQYDPGYYIGTGRIPKHLEGLKKYPFLLIFYGLILLLPLGYTLLKDGVGIGSISTIAFLILPLGLIVGGIQRLRNR